VKYNGAHYKLFFFGNTNWAKAHLSFLLIAGQLNNEIFLALAQSDNLECIPATSMLDCLSSNVSKFNLNLTWVKIA
jgi:hypothetical protein